MIDANCKFLEKHYQRQVQPIDNLACFIICVKRSFFLHLCDFRPCSRRQLL